MQSPSYFFYVPSKIQTNPRRQWSPTVLALLHLLLLCPRNLMASKRFDLPQAGLTIYRPIWVDLANHRAVQDARPHQALKPTAFAFQSPLKVPSFTVPSQPINQLPLFHTTACLPTFIPPAWLPSQAVPLQA